eukprot:TRINITY_DN839_c0_g1_i2.p1 TRINITY_DN839_c0_g1~~TRINITY_DN839_c0_g1_i2.p1  ORF type:complete len:491 (+),score=134.00 TRINITY_DN839_c0_g1_i2:69-1541(+)
MGEEMKETTALEEGDALSDGMSSKAVTVTDEAQKAAEKIQRWWKTKKASREWKLLVKRAKLMRRCIWVWHVRQTFLRWKNATVRIQRWWRLFSAQKKLKQLVLERRKEEEMRRRVREEQKQMDDEAALLEQLLKTAEQKVSNLEKLWNEQHCQATSDNNNNNNSLWEHSSSSLPTETAVRTLLKGEEYELNETTKRVMIGLGWDIAEGKAWDLDASVLLFKYTTHVDDVFYFKRQSNDGSIIHKGDSRTGGGGSDDERIFVNLRKVSLNINTLILVVTVFTKEGDFSLVRNAFIRLCDVTKSISGPELVRFTIPDCGNTTAMIMCKLFRSTPYKWRFVALGEPSYGQIYKHLIPKVAPFLTQAPPVKMLTITLHQAQGLPPDPTEFYKAIGGRESSPYCEIIFDATKVESKAIKRNCNPKWKQTLSIAGQANFIQINIRHKGKIKRRKFLGKVVLPVDEVISEKWFAVEGRGDDPITKDRGRLQISVYQA